MVVNGAEGEASRFSAVLAEYKKAPEVTRKRLYIEAMEGVYGAMNKIILDDAGGEKTLFIWVAYSRPGYNIISAGVEFLEGLIQNTSITGMEFHSDRPGWSRAAEKHGFKAITTVYKKEV